MENILISSAKIATYMDHESRIKINMTCLNTVNYVFSCFENRMYLD